MPMHQVRPPEEAIYINHLRSALAADHHGEAHLDWLAQLDISECMVGPWLRSESGHRYRSVAWIMLDEEIAYGIAMKVCNCHDLPFWMLLEEQIQATDRWISIGGIRWIVTGQEAQGVTLT